MIVYALRALLDALAPLIGAETELQKAVEMGWEEDVSEDKFKEWTDKGLEKRSEVERIVQQTAAEEYGRLLRKVKFLHCFLLCQSR